MSQISKKVSQILGFTIREGEWERFLTPIDQEGEPTRKNTASILFALCEEIERLERMVEDVKGDKKGRDTKESV